MPLPQLDLDNGHALVDNGCGDYAPLCPEHGVSRSWMHLGMVSQLARLGGDCAACGKPAYRPPAEG